MKKETISETKSRLMFQSHIATGAVALLLLTTTARGGGVVTSCTEANLRAAMAGGGLVTFACEGTITLSSTITNSLDTTLDGSGHQVTISGGDAVRVFYVFPGVTFAINHLTIARGQSTDGAGIFNQNGTVNATDAVFDSNRAVGPAGSSGWPGTAGTNAAGGAVVNSGGMNLINCSFTGNSAVGGAASPYNHSGYPGYDGGSGIGGAVWNAGLLTANGCTFAGNSATGGVGGNGGSSMPIPGAIGGPGGSGGDGAGGALFNSGVARLVNCTMAFNTGAGNAGGLGGGSYPYPPPTPPPPPGPNGSAGLGFGGIYDASGQCYLTNCTLAFNSCTGSTFGRGGIKTSGATMVNTLLAQNLPGGNCSGTITDLGHNLSSDTTCGFTHVGSMNNTYATLGPLTNNGGPTATIALLPGCRAIDAGDSAAAPSFDQRGVTRPFGLAADVGAYEYNSSTNPGPSTVVTECTEAALRAAMSGGGVVTFACDGTITLSNTLIITTNTALDAANHKITLSGRLRVFHVNSNVTLSLANLTISNAIAPNGAALLNAGGVVKATNCVFAANLASSPNESRGGAICNESGEVNLSACVFTANQAIGTLGASGLTGGSGRGGALDNSGTLTADLCLFSWQLGARRPWLFRGPVRCAWWSGRRRFRRCSL